MKWIIPFILVLAILGAGYYEYSLLQQITADATRISLVGITLREATLSFDLRITNPSHVPVFVDSIALDLNVLGTTIARIDDSESFELPAQGEADKTLLVKVPLASLGRSGIEAFQRGELDWQLTGTAQLRVLGFPHTETLLFENNKE